MKPTCGFTGAHECTGPSQHVNKNGKVGGICEAARKINAKNNARNRAKTEALIVLTGLSMSQIKANGWAGKGGNYIIEFVPAELNAKVLASLAEPGKIIVPTKVRASQEARAWMRTMKTPKVIISIKGEGRSGDAFAVTKHEGPAVFLTPSQFTILAHDTQCKRCATCEREFGKWEQIDENHRERLVPVQSHILKPRGQGGLAEDVFATCDICNRYLNRQRGMASLDAAKQACLTFKAKKQIVLMGE